MKNDEKKAKTTTAVKDPIIKSESSIGSPEGPLVDMQKDSGESTKNRSVGNGILTLAMIAAVILVVAVGIYIGISRDRAQNKSELDTVCVSVVSVDINPGIQLSVNKDNLIIEANATNADGEQVLNVVDIIGKDIKAGIAELLAAAKDLDYINGDTSVVLICASLTDPNAQESGNHYASQLESILTQLQQENEGNIFTVILTDKDIEAKAAQNGLSVGKQLLYDYALDNNFDISLQEFIDLSITELLEKMNLDTSGNANSTLNHYLSSSQSSGAASSGSSSSGASASSSSGSSSSSSSSSSTSGSKSSSASKSASSSSGDFLTSIKINGSGTTINFTWATLPAANVSHYGETYTGFKFYKVVASETDSTPSYPENGYIYVSSDLGTGNWSVDISGSSYNKNPALIAGHTYYFAVTYVFENGSFTTKTLQITLPGGSSSAAPTYPTIAPSLSYNYFYDTRQLSFSWNASPGINCSYDNDYTGFAGYKLVYSTGTPDFGSPAIYSTTSIGTTSCTLDLNALASTLPLGQNFTFKIYYMFSDGNIEGPMQTILIQ